jgi:hypothetical protein
MSSPIYEMSSTHCSTYGGKLNDLSSGEIHTVTVFVFWFLSPSDSCGIGAYGLTAIVTAIESLFFGAQARIILKLFTGP